MSQWSIPPDLHRQIEPGPTCFFTEHSIGSKDGLVPRYNDSHACVRCISALSEGRLSLDVHRIHKMYRRKFLEFWSFVEIDDPEECWIWHGETSGTFGSAQFSMKRHWNFGARYAPSRVATWFSWGDVGRLPLRSLCRNPSCCNPLHIRVRGVAHFFHNRKLDYVDLEFNSHKLTHETQLFLETTKEKDPKNWRRLNRINEAWLDFRMQQDGPINIADMRGIPEDEPAGDVLPEFDDPLL